MDILYKISEIYFSFGWIVLSVTGAVLGGLLADSFFSGKFNKKLILLTVINIVVIPVIAVMFKR